MSTKVTGKKASYTRHSVEYKQEALKLVTQIGVAKAAKQLGLDKKRGKFASFARKERPNLSAIFAMLLFL